MASATSTEVALPLDVVQELLEKLGLEEPLGRCAKSLRSFLLDPAEDENDLIQRAKLRLASPWAFERLGIPLQNALLKAGSACLPFAGVKGSDSNALSQSAVDELIKILDLNRLGSSLASPQALQKLRLSLEAPLLRLAQLSLLREFREMRKKASRRSRLLAKNAARLDRSSLPSQEDPESACTAKDDLERLSAQLPDAEHKKLLRLRFWEGKSTSKIASLLGLSKKEVNKKVDCMLKVLRSKRGICERILGLDE